MKKVKIAREFSWRTKSIFLELLYWEHNLCCHNLNVMYMEKNIYDSILDTLLDILGKTKDHVNAGYDL